MYFSFTISVSPETMKLFIFCVFRQDVHYVELTGIVFKFVGTE